MNQKSAEETVPKRRVFIVDDHPLVREGLANLINQQDDLTVCGQAEDAAQALAGMGVTRAELALIDISLKTASGLELVKHSSTEKPAPGVRFDHCSPDRQGFGLRLRAGDA